MSLEASVDRMAGSRRRGIGRRPPMRALRRQLAGVSLATSIAVSGAALAHVMAGRDARPRVRRSMPGIGRAPAGPGHSLPVSAQRAAATPSMVTTRAS